MVARLLQILTLLFVVVGCTKPHYDYEDNVDDWTLFSSQGEGEVHFFPDAQVEYWAMGVKATELCDAAIALDSASVLRAKHVSVAVYHRDDRSIYKFLEREEGTVPLLSFQIQPGEYIVILRFYHDGTASKRPKWMQSDALGYQKVASRSMWPLKVKSWLLKQKIRLKSKFALEPFVQKIDGVDFGAFGNPAASYFVGVMEERWTQQRLAHLLAEKGNSAAYAALSIYNIDGTLLQTLSLNELVTEKSGQFFIEHVNWRGKLFIVRVVE